MNQLKNFLLEYGLNEKEINVYLSCLSLGASGVTEIARKAGTKRPGTYLVLNELIKKGLVDLMQEKDKTRYYAKNPKQLFQKIENLQQERESILPQLLNLYKNKSLKPVINVFDDYKTYDKLADNVRDYVKSGKEAIYFGNSEHFMKKENKAELWFKIMRNKNTKCREVIIGDSLVQREYIKKVRELGNPNYKIKQLINPKYGIETEFGIWGNTLYLFSGSGKELYTIVVENSQIVNMHRSMFELIWGSLPN